MLVWHRRLWLIDHGAALYFHHTWANYRERSRDAFALIKDHVLLRLAGALEAADAQMSERMTPDIIGRVVQLIPDAWLAGDTFFADSRQYREAYNQFLVKRLEFRQAFVEEAIRARSLHL